MTDRKTQAQSHLETWGEETAGPGLPRVSLPPGLRVWGPTERTRTAAPPFWGPAEPHSRPRLPHALQPRNEFRRETPDVASGLHVQPQSPSVTQGLAPRLPGPCTTDARFSRTHSGCGQRPASYTLCPKGRLHSILIL